MLGMQQTGQGTGRLEEPFTKVHSGATLAGPEAVFGGVPTTRGEHMQRGRRSHVRDCSRQMGPRDVAPLHACRKLGPHQESHFGVGGVGTRAMAGRGAVGIGLQEEWLEAPVGLARRSKG